MHNRQQAGPRSLLVQMILNLLAGSGAGAVATALLFSIIEMMRREHVVDIGEGLSLFFLVLLIALIYSMPGVLMLVFGGEYIARRIPIIPKKGIGFVLLLGISGLGLALLASFLLLWSFSFNLNDNFIGNTMIAAGMGGTVAGVVVAMRIGGKKDD